VIQSKHDEPGIMIIGHVLRRLWQGMDPAEVARLAEVSA
jgi:hypothetical protein